MNKEIEKQKVMWLKSVMHEWLGEDGMEFSQGQLLKFMRDEGFKLDQQGLNFALKRNGEVLGEFKPMLNFSN